MNPIIVIPTYWSARRPRNNEFWDARYEHSSIIGIRSELVRCLESLTHVDSIDQVPIALLVATEEESAAERAASWVRLLTASFPRLSTIVVGDAEVSFIHKRLAELSMEDGIPGISLKGYGAIRNVGFALAAITGHDCVIFLDDDEVVEAPDFIERACYGLGGQTKHGVPVLVKTGVWIDKDGSYRAEGKDHWYNVAWGQGRLFNQYIEQAMVGARLSRANTLYGGLSAVHYEAYRRVSFDPWIARGEDLDYLINLRMYGLESWLDDSWTIRHLPPATLSEPARFAKDVYRWFYQQQKIEYGRVQIDLLQIRPHDLDPYPGPFLEHSLGRRVFFTALLRSIALKGHGNYLRIAFRMKRKAEAWAAQNNARYFEFQYHWPAVIARIEGDVALAQQIYASDSSARLGLSEKLFSEGLYQEAQDILVPVHNVSGDGMPADFVSAEPLEDFPADEQVPRKHLFSNRKR